jgi:ADP-heptose:LPS heptosyltransferase
MLRKALAVLDEDPDEAHRIAVDILREDPNNVSALFLCGVVYARAERHGVALPMFERVTRLAPRKSEGWSNVGLCLQETGLYQEAREAFKKALALEQRPNFMANLAAAYNQEGNHVEALRWCKKALEKDPQNQARGTMAFAKLAMGDWSGWKDFDATLGGRFRKEVKIGDEPRWDGQPTGDLFIYGEQGLGDEIMYASCLPDAAGRAEHVTLECDGRLEGLFQRSFPAVEVHGTRRTERAWATGRDFRAGAAIGSLPAFFRPDIGACPRVPYLVADPERRLQWKALFESWGKPVVGLCWTGGRHTTQKSKRAIGLEAFRPYIEANKDKVFVSLQYNDATEEIKGTGLPVRHIHRAVQSPDYDDTAAFVAECDFLVGPPTTVHHLAGALGVPSVVLVPHAPMWNVAHGDRIPWNAKQMYHRQKQHESWTDCIKRMNVEDYLA